MKQKVNKEEDNRTDVLMRMLALQRADGGFDLDAGTAAVMGMDLAALEKTAGAMAGGRELSMRILCTALVLAVLERRFAAERPTWQGMVKKSRAWLDQALKDAPLAVEGKTVADWAADYAGREVHMPAKGPRKGSARRKK